MRVEVTSKPFSAVEADLHAIGLLEGDELPAELRGASGAGDVKPRFEKLTLLRPERPRRLLVVGLGKREDLESERLRVAAALAVTEAGRHEARSIAWDVPDPGTGPPPGARAAALVEGTVLASYRFDRFKSRDPDDPPPPVLERLALAAGDDADAAAGPAEAARARAEAANRARELQSLPSNVVTPSYLADRAREIAEASEAVSVEVLGRAEIEERGMGGLAAVARGTAEEPALIALRYGGGDGEGETLGLVGKAVTFDSGGLSIKPPASMPSEKGDMSGGAAVIAAMGALAELGVPVRCLAVVAAAEN
ncbi:MAG TPA: M17 family peptidase N-terminal domain-containing protein, partial [Solirubrobacterales bacterium]|nr:M17 family peptidase N-terminal domain-containing protein [Solirubrobacterales bacterium]